MSMYVGSLWGKQFKVQLACGHIHLKESRHYYGDGTFDTDFGVHVYVELGHSEGDPNYDRAMTYIHNHAITDTKSVWKICACERKNEDDQFELNDYKVFQRFRKLYEASEMRNNISFVSFYQLSTGNDPSEKEEFASSARNSAGAQYTDWTLSDEENLTAGD